MQQALQKPVHHQQSSTQLQGFGTKMLYRSGTQGERQMLRVAVQREEKGRFVKVNLEIATDNLISQRLIAIQIGVLRRAFSGKEARGFSGGTRKPLG